MSDAKPRFGWRNRPFPYLDESYAPSAELIDRVCREFQIDDGRPRSKLVNSATYAAQAYATYSHNHDAGPTKNEQRSAINTVNRNSQKLIRLLETLDDRTSNTLGLAAHEIVHRNTLGDATELREIGVMRGSLEDEQGVEYLTIDDVLPALKLLSLVAAETRNRIGTSKHGPRPRLALRHWADVMARYWVKELDRSFTFDTHEGQGVTDSYRFLETMLQAMDPRAVRHLPSIAAEVRTDLRAS